MAIFLKIPIESGLSDQKLTVEINGAFYVLRVLWNETAGYWSLSVLQTDDTPILTNIKMVKNFPLVARYAKTGMPLGDFYFIQENGDSLRPTYEDLGTTHGLYYYEPDAEVIAEQTGGVNQDSMLGTVWDDGFTIWDGGVTLWDK